MHNVSIHNHKYIYHLSDYLKHNFAFTFSVRNHLPNLDNEISLIYLKSDNRSTKYQSKHAFGYNERCASYMKLWCIQAWKKACGCNEWIGCEGTIEEGCSD